MKRITLKDIFLEIESAPLFKNLNMTIDLNFPTQIIGASGSGKTVLLKLLAGLIPPRNGSLLYDDIDLFSLKQSEFLSYQGRTGFMFQGGALWANQNIFNNLALPIEVKNKHKSQKEIRGLILLALKRFGLEALTLKRPADLSRGERKIVAYIRSIISDQELLFLDEPLALLSNYQKILLLQDLERQKNENKKIILVSDKVIFLSKIIKQIIYIKRDSTLLFISEKDFFTYNDDEWQNYLKNQRNLNHGNTLGEAGEI